MNNSQKKIDRLVESILNEEVDKKVNSIMEQLKGKISFRPPRTNLHSLYQLGAYGGLFGCDCDF
jgi:hypothetical protein